MPCDGSHARTSRSETPNIDRMGLHAEELAVVAVVVLAALLAVAIRWLVKVGSGRS